MQRVFNVPYFRIQSGNHSYLEGRTSWIGITDVGIDPPVPARAFCRTLTLSFADAEPSIEPYNPTVVVSDIPPHHYISPAQAKEIAKFLDEEYRAGRDVVVSCMAGICRSGAVCSAAHTLGFEWTPDHYSPNLYVRNMVREEIYKLEGVSTDEEGRPDA